MRPLVIFILLSICKCLLGQTIYNHSFESINPDQGQITSWTTSKTEETIISIDLLNYVDGTKSLKISGSSIGWIRQAIPFNSPVAKPTRIRFKAQIKTDLKKGYVKLLGRVIDNSGITNYQAMLSKKIFGKTDWAEYSLDMIIDSLTKEIRVAGYFDGTGEAYFDNFRFTPINAPEVSSNSQEVLDYTKKYLKIIKDNALYKDSIDFDSVEKTAVELSKSVSSTNDCLPILTYTLHKLKDGHSFLMPGEDVENWESDDQNVIYASSKVVGNVGYISIPQFNSNSNKITQGFADSLQTTIKWLDKSKVKGWIVDLRDNGGGNCWPMIAGIGPLAGNGTYGYFISRNGEKKPWSYSMGASKEGDSIAVRVHNPYTLLNTKRPIAVLINEGTASSAEIIAISFIGLPTAKLFGKPSYGATTSNEEFKLDDGSIMFLCSGVYATRHLKKFGHKIQPDRYVETTTDSDTDKVLEEAIKWIKTKK